MPTLFVHHYHFRPGGVRRVIECGLVEWARSGRWDRVILSSGEEIEAGWFANLRNSLGGIVLETLVDHRLGYSADFSHGSLEDELAEMGGIFREAWRKTRPDLVWAHNLSVGRNVQLGLALARTCEAEEIPMLCHDHDWWVDQRWNKWREMRELGIDSLPLAAEATLPTGPLVRHACVHPRDARILSRQLGTGAVWIPNPPPENAEVSQTQLLAVQERLGSGPIWLAPCRILRRKNLIEAVLLTKLLRPDATLIVTGRPSSSGETEYGNAVAQAAKLVGLKYRFGVADDEHLEISALMAAAECVLQTSVQEGFGLPVIEAATLHRPLILRELAELTTWLVGSGGKFPLIYKDINVPDHLVSPTEKDRWKLGWEQECAQLPAAWRNQARDATSHPSGKFSGFTLAGQLELLENWDTLKPALMKANPWLDDWKSLASTGQLPAATAPEWSQNWAEQMDQLLTKSATTSSSLAAIQELFETALPDAGKFPILWQSPQTRGGK